MDGHLLGPEQNAQLQLEALPLDVFEPLIQAALPQLKAERAPAPNSPFAKPLAVFQRQLKRSAEALTLPAGALRDAQEASALGADAMPAPIRGLLSAEGALRGDAEAPVGDLRMRVDKAVLGMLPLSEAMARMHVGADRIAHMRASLVPSGASGRIDAECRAHVPDGSALEGHVTVRDNGMLVLTELTGGEVQWQEGRANLRGAVHGSVDDPVVTGVASFSRGKIAVPNLKEPLRAVSGRVTLEGNTLTVNNVRAACGRVGQMRVTGSLPLRARSQQEIAAPAARVCFLLLWHSHILTCMPLIMPTQCRGWCILCQRCAGSFHAGASYLHKSPASIYCCSHKE